MAWAKKAFQALGWGIPKFGLSQKRLGDRCPLFRSITRTVRQQSPSRGFVPFCRRRYGATCMCMVFAVLINVLMFFWLKYYALLYHAIIDCINV
jgi:hypothetical protein